MGASLMPNASCEKSAVREFVRVADVAGFHSVPHQELRAPGPAPGRALDHAWFVRCVVEPKKIVNQVRHGEPRTAHPDRPHAPSDPLAPTRAPQAWDVLPHVWRDDRGPMDSA